MSVLTQAWGEAWAKSVHGDKEWKTGRTYGIVLRRESGKWICDFAENDGKYAGWERKPLRLEKRAAAPAASGSGGKAAGKAPAQAPAPAPACADSSDESDLDSSEDEMEQPDDGVVKSADGWKRNDNVLLRSLQRGTTHGI